MLWSLVVDLVRARQGPFSLASSLRGAFGMELNTLSRARLQIPDDSWN